MTNCPELTLSSWLFLLHGQFLCTMASRTFKSWQDTALSANSNGQNFVSFASSTWFRLHSFAMALALYHTVDGWSGSRTEQCFAIQLVKHCVCVCMKIYVKHTRKNSHSNMCRSSCVFAWYICTYNTYIAYILYGGCSCCWLVYSISFFCVVALFVLKWHSIDMNEI